jgi:hypothetical protein
VFFPVHADKVIDDDAVAAVHECDDEQISRANFQPHRSWLLNIASDEFNPYPDWRP